MSVTTMEDEVVIPLPDDVTHLRWAGRTYRLQSASRSTRKVRNETGQMVELLQVHLMGVTGDADLPADSHPSPMF